MSRRAISIFLLFAVGTWANASPVSLPMEISGGLGYPNVSIANPSGANAFYDGIAVLGKAAYRFIGKPSEFNSGIFAGYRYLSLFNTADNAGQKEKVDQYGPGAGLSIGYSALFVSGEYFLLKARHYATGTYNKFSEYSYPLVSFEGGVKFLFGGFTLGASGSFGMGTLSKSETGLSKDSKYQETIFWVHLTGNLDSGDRK